MKKESALACMAGIAVLAFGAIGNAAEPAGACPAPVPGFVPPAAGEHPRLFFRKAELPAIKARAATEDGKRIVVRLRFLLDGANGDEMPELYNDCPKIEDRDHAPSSGGRPDWGLPDPLSGRDRSEASCALPSRRSGSLAA